MTEAISRNGPLPQIDQGWAWSSLKMLLTQKEHHLKSNLALGLRIADYRCATRPAA